MGPKLSSNERASKMKKNEPLLTPMRQKVLEIPHLKVMNLKRRILPVYRFSASFPHRYDVTDAIRQDNEKMKVKYLRSLLFLLFEILQAVETSLGYKFRCYGNQNQKQNVYGLSKPVSFINNLKRCRLIITPADIIFEKKMEIHFSYCKKIIVF